MAEAEWAQIVETHDVVRVRVGGEHSVEVGDALADGLNVKVWSGIDQDRAVSVLHQDRRPRAAIVWIAGVADTAITPQRRHAHRRAASQYRQCRFHFLGAPAPGACVMALVSST